MEKNLKYETPELKVMRYQSTDVITESGDAPAVDPPWGGEVTPFI